MRGSVTMIVLEEDSGKKLSLHRPLHLRGFIGIQTSSSISYLIKSGTGVEVM